MIIRCLIVPLTVIAFAVQAGPVSAQGAFPAPLPAGVTPAPASNSPFPPVNGVIKNDPAFPPVNSAPMNDSAFPPVNGAPRAPIGAPPSAFPSNGAPPVSGAGFSPMQQGASQQGVDECMSGFMHRGDIEHRRVPEGVEAPQRVALRVLRQRRSARPAPPNGRQNA